MRFQRNYRSDRGLKVRAVSSESALDPDRRTEFVENPGGGGCRSRLLPVGARKHGWVREVGGEGEEGTNER